MNTANDWSFLRLHGITHVINCISHFFTGVYEGYLPTLRLQMNDSVDYDAENDIIMAVQFMAECAYLGGKVLIHCHQGLSRSVTLAIAYLIEQKKMNSIEALDYVSNLRNDICPNIGFV